MEQFDIIVIGGGPGGYLCAERAAQAGLSAAVIERRALGGTCLNEGCVPTKSLLYCTKQYSAARHGEDFGVIAENVTFDQRKAVERKNHVVTRLVRGVASAMKTNGVKVFSAEGTVLGRDSEGLFQIKAGDSLLSARRLVAATGSSAVIPPIPGVKEGLQSGFVMTNREILDITELPETLCCIGGGVIGLEMACYFASVGVKVTVIEMLPKIAGAVDADICNVLMKTYKKEGMEFVLGARVLSIGEGSVTYENSSGVHTLSCGKVLLAAGRRANIDGAGLEPLGVKTERGAVCVDERLMTNIAGVYAVGDCNGKSMLAHTAYREAEVAVNNIMGLEDRMDYSVVPSVIYTNPEVASVGESELSAKEKGLNVKAVKAPMLFSGRYAAETVKGEGFCKLVYDLDGDCLVGVHMVGSYSSEIIYGAAEMLRQRLPLGELKKIVFPHPTVGEVIREALYLL